jgi:hypothetical protein
MISYAYTGNPIGDEVELVISLMATGFLAIHASRLVAARLHTDSTFLALPARLLLGIALVTCLMNVFLRFLPGVSSAWISLFVLAAAAAAGASRQHGNASIRDKKGQACLLLLAVLVLGWRLMTQIKLGSLMPAEGTDNADELWYIFSAHWLYGHSLLHPFASDPAFPLAASAGVNIGLLPRIGAETLLVFFAALSGTGIEQVYPVLFAVAAVFFCFTAAMGFVEEGAQHWRFLPLAFIAIALSPVALFIFGNGNFATLWGLIFIGGYYWNMHQALNVPDSSGNAIAAGIFLGSLLATYPELLAIAVPASAVMYLQAGWGPAHRWRRAMWPFAVTCAVAVLCAPYALLDAIKVLSTGASAAQGANVIFPTLFSSLTAGNLLYTLLTFDTEGLMGRLPAGVSSLVFLVALTFAPRRVWIASAGLVLACIPVLLMFWLKNYGYGGMKAIEFIALPAATLIGASAGRCATLWRDSALVAGTSQFGARWWSFVRALCVLLALAIFATVSFSRSRQYDIHGHASLLTPELTDLRRARMALPPNAVVQVGPELGPVPFLASRWIAYQLHDIPLVFPAELHGGGYIYRLDAGHQQRMATVTHILRARDSAGAQLPGAVFRNNAFEIVPVGSLPYVFGKGFHSHEGWGRWMAASGVLELRGRCARSLRIDVFQRFGPLKGEDAIVVSAGKVSVKYPLTDGHGKLVFDVPEGADEVTLRSAAGGVAPASIGAHDDRVLSYGIKTIELPSCNL